MSNSMNFRVKVDLKNVENKIGNKNLTAGRRVLANEMLKDMNRFVPKRNNGLRQSGQIATDGSSISWSQKYARRQFFGNFRHYTTPGTSGHWDKRARAVYGQKWARILVKGMLL